MNGKIALRIVSALVLIAAIAGIAFFAFQAGVAKGSPVTIQAPSGEAAQQMPYYGMPFGYRGYHGMPFFGFGCFGILIPLFLFFLAAKAFRMMLWGPRWSHRMHGGHSPWGRGGWGEGGVPPMFNEWHKRAHGETPADDKKE
jgi:hypothetical protein